VHAKGSYTYLQLWALGHAATPSVLSTEDPSFPFVSASDVPLKRQNDGPLPCLFTVSEIHEYVELYATAASNVVHRAGFNGVEVHSANGYLVDRFLQDVSNVHTDEYGGSIENRTCFALEIIDAIVRWIGESKTAICISPWGTFNSEKSFRIA
jgi:NADPH2 dehydrogenase